MTEEDLAEMLSSDNGQMEDLLSLAGRIKEEQVGSGVYLRGLIEYSNVCSKNCYYCGIRSGNGAVSRYTLSEEEVLGCARVAFEGDYGSVVIQGGENRSPEHGRTVARLVKEIKSLSDGKLGITLSLGEQSRETYRRWFEAGAHRYLLRIETSDRYLYNNIHPGDENHSFDARLQALADLRYLGYQVGTGVMIGLPGQTVESLARDLIFMREADIDMCGMGPYVESAGTPLAENSAGALKPLMWRYEMALKIIATLRIIMPDINIAATTALQAISPDGRLRAIKAGANVIMPNLTPHRYRGSYFLYDNKPLSLDSRLIEENIVYGQWGDSARFRKRNGPVKDAEDAGD